ncbi:hypothetical protein P171DRAFT_427543 [Karstenula rhodostoma CBS 690.94]|uniref:Uncharacterized protein n=1 Tax=Karstenula rhodostoma CBS 690.94 TaxID=1392251 RepID=A0A9P4PU13_9PLEO|nr:hypothetical protein P171DRAFT_427543 [Karstenula rhodostoma CBS 690.94]
MMYRLTYKDDEEWTRFLAYFKRRTHKNLDESGDEDLILHIAWDVHEDPAMEGASSSQVRAHFRERVESLTTVRRFGDQLHESKGIDQWSGGIPRNMACLAINQVYVDRSIKDAELDDATASEKGFMMLVSI